MPPPIVASSDEMQAGAGIGAGTLGFGPGPKSKPTHLGSGIGNIIEESVGMRISESAALGSGSKPLHGFRITSPETNLNDESVFSASAHRSMLLNDPEICALTFAEKTEMYMANLLFDTHDPKEILDALVAADNVEARRNKKKENTHRDLSGNNTPRNFRHSGLLDSDPRESSPMGTGSGILGQKAEKRVSIGGNINVVGRSS